MAIPPILDLGQLATGNIPAITPALGAALAEAACVSLERQGLIPSVHLIVQGISQGQYVLCWNPATDQARRSWKDERQAAAKGAEGISVLIARGTIGFEVISVSRQGTGFDYWLGERIGSDFVARAGLEVSGINNGDESDVRARVQDKLRQARQSGTQQWQTFAIVVEFSRPLAEVRKNV